MDPRLSHCFEDIQILCNFLPLGGNFSRLLGFGLWILSDGCVAFLVHFIDLKCVQNNMDTIMKSNNGARKDLARD